MVGDGVRHPHAGVLDQVKGRPCQGDEHGGQGREPPPVLGDRERCGLIRSDQEMHRAVQDQAVQQVDAVGQVPECARGARNQGAEQRVASSDQREGDGERQHRPPLADLVRGKQCHGQRNPRAHRPHATAGQLLDPGLLADPGRQAPDGERPEHPRVLVVGPDGPGSQECRCRHPPAGVAPEQQGQGGQQQVEHPLQRQRPGHARGHQVGLFDAVEVGCTADGEEEPVQQSASERRQAGLQGPVGERAAQGHHPKHRDQVERRQPHHARDVKPCPVDRLASLVEQLPDEEEGGDHEEQRHAGLPQLVEQVGGRGLPSPGSQVAVPDDAVVQEHRQGQVAPKPVDAGVSAWLGGFRRAPQLAQDPDAEPGQQAGPDQPGRVLLAHSRRRAGNRMTSRMLGASVSSIIRRSMPMPQPPVGGRPYSSARM